MANAPVDNRSKSDSTPDIYAYHDYRLFLREQFHYLKTAKGLSTRQLAKSSGVSESYLSMVVNGVRKLSVEQLDKLAPTLQIARSEASYLEWLITLAEADAPEEKLKALKKIQRFRRYRNLNPLEIETYRYLEKWYHVAIRELAQLPTFRGEAKWIQSRLRFKVSLPDVKEALEFLVEHGFLERDKAGDYHKPEKLIQCKTGVLKPALTKFHTEMLSLATHSLSEVSSEERNISALTCAIAEEDVPQAKAILEEARQRLVALAQGGAQPDRVYHFGFIAFPLTRKMGEDV